MEEAGPRRDDALEDKPRKVRARKTQKNTRAIDIAQRMRKQIIEGEIAPGTHLYEEALAAQFGTSRTPLRAALTVLAQEKLLTYAPNRGYQVPQFSVADIEQAYEIRGQLEGYAARVAAERGLSPDTERQIRACLNTVDLIVQKGALVATDQDAWRRMNIVFHHAICDSAQNRFLEDMLQTTRSVPLVSNALAQWYDYETVRRYHADHHAIFDAIRNRQSSRAEHLMREHIYQANELIRRSILGLETP